MKTSHLILIAILIASFALLVFKLAGVFPDMSYWIVFSPILAWLGIFMLVAIGTYIMDWYYTKMK